MNKKDRIVVNRLNHNSSYQHKLQNKLKNKLREFQNRSLQINKALSQKNMKNNRRIFFLDGIPSSKILNRKAYQLPKIFSQFLSHKIGNTQKPNINDTQCKQRDSSVKTIRQSLEKKIIQNARLHNLSKKIPKTKLQPIKRQKKSKTEQREQSFVIWAMKEKQEQMCSPIILISKNGFSHNKTNINQPQISKVE